MSRMSQDKRCPECVKMQKAGTPVRYKAKDTTCDVCKKHVKRILDLHHTNADLCSLDCERTYWLDILY